MKHLLTCTIPIVAAIAGIVTVELYALSVGIDGALLMSSMTMIGALAGYQVKSLQAEFKSRKPKK